jgi:hypothetical protein
VVLVDDEVAGAEVGERLERTPDARVASRRPLAEDLRVRQEREAELAPDEAAPRRCDREQELALARQVGRGLERMGVDPTQQVLRPGRLAAVREGDDDAVAAADE